MKEFSAPLESRSEGESAAPSALCPTGYQSVQLTLDNTKL